MAPRTVPVTREELTTRRERILAGLGVTRDEFESRIEAGALLGDEWYAAEDLEEIAFLLGDDGRD